MPRHPRLAGVAAGAAVELPRHPRLAGAGRRRCSCCCCLWCGWDVDGCCRWCSCCGCGCFEGRVILVRCWGCWRVWSIRWRSCYRRCRRRAVTDAGTHAGVGTGTVACGQGRVLVADARRRGGALPHRHLRGVPQPHDERPLDTVEGGGVRREEHHYLERSINLLSPLALGPTI